MELDPPPDPRDVLISSLLSLLLTYKSTCDAYELELETQLRELAIANSGLEHQLTESQQRYEALRVRSKQNLACFHFQGQDYLIRHLEGEWSSALVEVSACKSRQAQLESLLEKVVINRVDGALKHGKRLRAEAEGEVQKYWKDNKRGVRR